MIYLLCGLILLISPVKETWAMLALSGYGEKSPLVGKPAADVALSKSDGTTGRILASCHGKKAILIFWATWCPHCYIDLGEVHDSLESLKQKGIEVVLIDIGEDKAQVQGYMDRRKFNMTSFLDFDSATQDTYDLVGLPTLVFVDEKGIIRSEAHAFPPNLADFFGVKSQ